MLEQNYIDANKNHPLPSILTPSAILCISLQQNPKRVFLWHKRVSDKHPLLLLNHNGHRLLTTIYSIFGQWMQSQGYEGDVDFLRAVYVKSSVERMKMVFGEDKRGEECPFSHDCRRQIIHGEDERAADVDFSFAERTEELDTEYGHVAHLQSAIKTGMCSSSGQIQGVRETSYDVQKVER
ncbi:hypothetical protein ACLOJK_001006, partial [Asimina triloba]